MNTSPIPNHDISDQLDTDTPDARRRLLARKLQQQRAHPSMSKANPPSDDAPLSFAQEGLWFLDQLATGGAAYNIHSVTRLQGPLDAERLERSLQALVARHASLRTAFLATERGPVQQVVPASQAQERFHLARSEPAPNDGTDAVLAQHVAACIAQPFDLSRAPLLRAELLRIAPDHHLLVLVVHHIVADGWSMSVIHRELAQLYALRGDACVLPALSLQFPDHALRQRQRYERGGIQAQLDYWRTKLRDLHTLELPTDKARPSQAGFAGRTLPFGIDSELSTALRALARQQGSTLFMTLLAAFHVLLARYSGQTDIAVGVPLAGRDDAAVRDLVGYFVNTVVIRGDLQGRPGFTELLQRVRQSTLEALTHQDMPFDRLVVELNPERDASRNPLYQVSFALENFADRALHLDGLRSERLDVRSETSKFDLSLTVTESGDHLDAAIEYRTDLFEAQAIARMAAHLRHLLAAIVADPDCAVDRLPLMDAAERQLLLVDWNAQSRTHPHDQPVHALFRAQAMRTPDAIALRFGQMRMTYRELDALSEQLAHALRTLGAGPEVVVGLCMQRCFGLVVGLLAICKSGAAFLPLDPDHPPERLQGMLADAAPAFVLTQSHLADRLRQLDPAQASKIIEVPDHGGERVPDPLPALTDLTQPDHLAYLIYTSGSTGKPKAAQLMHRGLSNHVQWMNDALGLTPGDRVLQKTAVSFDASAWEFFSTLSSGATLVIAQPDVHQDMRLLAEAIRESDISVVQFVPSELRVMLNELEGMECPSLRYVLSGGEAMDRALALSFRRILPSVRLGNFYGPSEATVDSAWYEVGEQPPDRLFVPIGRPIANGQLYILDAQQQPQPVNVAGELYIGGHGVGRGYRNRPDLTAERFVPNPFRPGETMYRTGDLARWLHDGVVEFIGRNDHQVKLRGLRIELGEIESALAACDSVRMSAVLLRETTPGRQELVAYVVRTGSADAGSLRSALKSRLPDYMIPSVFMFLSELPRLTSGKLDRNRLPDPDTAPSVADLVAPRSPIESALLDIWTGVLDKSGFGVRDNFFDLGGHSLLAMQIVSRVRATLRIELPLRGIFEQPTIEEMARTIGSLASDPGAARATPLAPIVALPRTGPLPVSFSQRRMWVLNQMDPQGAAYNMRDSLRLRGPLGKVALQRALDQLVARHESFRTTYGFGDTEPMAFVGAAQPANLIHLSLSAVPEAERDVELEQQAARIASEPFDLASTPLHRFVLIERDENDHVLVLVMHHIIGDDWSWGILLRELQDLYAAELRGLATPPKPRAIDFIDYASWQRGHINDDLLAGQTRYWLRQLADMSPLNLSSDTAAAQRLTSQGDRVRRDFPQGWLAGVKRFGSGLGLTPFMTLLAAFQALLSRYCGQEDVVVGTPIAGRTRVESERLVGSLVNTLALRAHVRPAQSFMDLAQQVRETCLSAFTHQDIPFDYLMDQLHKQAPGARAPEVRVMFNVLNTPRKTPQLEGLDTSFLPLNLRAAQFDLALTIDTECEHSLSLSYSTELFAPATAQAMLDNYMHLLDLFIQQPERPLHDHSAASPLELARLASWNQTDAAYPHHLTVHELLGVRHESAGIAIMQMPGAALSHAELWPRVHRLAHALRARGVQRGALVGLCIERSPAMVVAQLAVLSAGGAYVPLDPAYPLQRLHDMAQDAALALLLTEQDLAGLWREIELPMLLLDQAQPELMAHPETPLPPDGGLDARPEDPAYVIYTSGSTGKPKGVAVPHRAVVNFLLSMRNEPGLEAHDVLVAVTTLSFDIAVLELLLPLLLGATVVLATREQAVDGDALRTLIDQAHATVMQATPATWRMLIDAGWTGSPSFKALVGGESLSPHLAEQLSERTGELWNLYGPTETTVWSTCWKVPSQPQTISIGRPIANTSIHVLDAQGHRCPAGVSGEIFIGGDGVTSGYLRQPELTAERFIPDPFSPHPQARLYRTGDRGRWRHDGLLEHQGRLDFQVKVRGHRIELGEIEARLQLHPTILQCLVIAREDRPGDARLVAYVVARGGALDTPALRDHLRLSLPDYMLPQYFVALEALPLLPNGKINRHALPAPRIEQRTDAVAGHAPATPAEMALARIWSELLKVDSAEISRLDNFFDLGGDSLQVGQIVVAFQRTSGVRLAARRMVFESLAQLAHDIELPERKPVQAPETPGWFKRLFKS
ncbi:Tyrocidine synthase III [Variovorax sp. SRS16]|uniref:non-ribosomal peptide synthetase n=1 Tax=Variovorax sp. SRS16 TaxID=282217 RepID=UPI00131612E3|nr:non-ribosomal peptide synthetase [Variovorax sp. SRS16]VTU14934.1 Tyrocidine synthase III [Variovorax sp. SRS16]